MKELYTTAGIFVVLILLGVWMVQNNRNEQEAGTTAEEMGKKAGETDGTGKERKTGSVSETKSRGKLLRGRDYLE